jgi:hypothetical protein
MTDLLHANHPVFTQAQNVGITPIEFECTIGRGATNANKFLQAFRRVSLLQP